MRDHVPHVSDVSHAEVCVQLPQGSPMIERPDASKKETSCAPNPQTPLYVEVNSSVTLNFPEIILMGQEPTSLGQSSPPAYSGTLD